MNADDKNNLHLITSAIICTSEPQEVGSKRGNLCLAKHRRNKQQHTSASAMPVSQDDMCDLEPLSDLKHCKPVSTLFYYQV